MQRYITRFISGILFLGILLSIQSSIQAAGNSYYVSPTGNDSASGSEAQPWRTIGKANTTLQAGDTVYIAEGTYDAIIEPFYTGTEGNPITYTAVPGDRVTIRGTSPDYPVVAIGVGVAGDWSADNYIVIDGLHIIHASTKQNANFENIRINGTSVTHATIRNCVISRSGNDGLAEYNNQIYESGIVIAGAGNTLLENNVIEGVGKIGIWIQETTNPTYNIIRNNRVSNTGHNALNVSPADGVVSGTLIEGNTFEGSGTSDGIQFEHSGPTEIDNRGYAIRNNIIRNNAENAVDLKGAHRILIEGNTVYGNTGDNNGSTDGGDTGGGVGGFMHGANSSSTDVIIRRNILYDNLGAIKMEDGYSVYNNTIIGNNRTYEGAGATSDVTSISGSKTVSADITLLNNVFAGQLSDTYIGFNESGTSGTVIDANAYVGAPSTVSFLRYLDINTSTYVTFNAWVTALEQNVSLLGNENNTQVISSLKLKNVSSPYQPVGSYAQTDFDLQEGSPLIDSGQPLTHTTSSGAGTTVPVRNARVFSDGFGIISGDMIVVGTHKGAQVTGVDVSANTIKVDRSVSWGSQDPVTLTYSGNAPDIGAREYLQATIPTPTTAVPTPIDNKPGVCLSGYRDVPKTYTFQEHIQNLTCDGVVGGYEDKTFRPDTSVTRAEMAKFITNAFQLPTNTTCQPFSDVPSNHTFYPVIMSLKCNGVSSGYEDGTYKPDEPIRRGEAMKFVVRGARIGADNSSLFSYNGSDIRFADVPSDYTFYEVIMGASNQQVISGFESGLFEPDAFITRGAMAKIVDNARTTAGVSE